MRLRSVALIAVAVSCGGLTLIAAEKKQGSENNDFKKKYNVEELRKKLAYQSLVDRLAYESKAADRRIVLPPEATETWQQIDNIDSNNRIGKDIRTKRWPNCTPTKWTSSSSGRATVSDG